MRLEPRRGFRRGAMARRRSRPGSTREARERRQRDHVVASFVHRRHDDLDHDRLKIDRPLIDDPNARTHGEQLHDGRAKRRCTRAVIRADRRFGRPAGVSCAARGESDAKCRDGNAATDMARTPVIAPQSCSTTRRHAYVALAQPIVLASETLPFTIAACGGSGPVRRRVPWTFAGCRGKGSGMPVGPSPGRATVTVTDHS